MRIILWYSRIRHPHTRVWLVKITYVTHWRKTFDFFKLFVLVDHLFTLYHSGLFEFSLQKKNYVKESELRKCKAWVLLYQLGHNVTRSAHLRCSAFLELRQEHAGWSSCCLRQVYVFYDGNNRVCYLSLLKFRICMFQLESKYKFSLLEIAKNEVFIDKAQVGHDNWLLKKILISFISTYFLPSHFHSTHFHVRSFRIFLEFIQKVNDYIFSYI